MSLKTRLDGRTTDNCSLKIVDEKGELIADIKLLGNSGATLEVVTKEGLHIEKPSGWSSKTK